LARWGLCLEEIEDLGFRLEQFCRYFNPPMRTKTRDTSRYGFHYLSELLRMDKHRNMATISRNTGQSAQNMHYFISNSPWSACAVLDRIQEAIISRGEIDSGAMLLLDESADEKAGEYSGGTAR
jgi:SRSO17 transposase